MGSLTQLLNGSTNVDILILASEIKQEASCALNNRQKKSIKSGQNVKKGVHRCY